MAQASDRQDARQLRANQAVGPPRAVFLAFDNPAPTNAADPCRTGTTYKQNEIGDHDDITVCTFDSSGNPSPTDASTEKIAWKITNLQGAPSPALGFQPSSLPAETSGTGAQAHAGIGALQNGNAFVHVDLVDGNGSVIDSFFIEKQVGDPCAEPAAMGEGQRPNVPHDATDVEGPVYFEEDQGPLSSLYPNLDTTTDAFYSQVTCDPSIGGTLPPDATQPPSQDELDVQAFVDGFDQKAEDLVADLQLNPPGSFRRHRGVPSSLKRPRCTVPSPAKPGYHVVSCDDPIFLRDNQPFAGRDVVYVHGLALGHFEEWLKNNWRAHRKWPAQPSQFLNPNGYFRKYAENYWRDHIREHLFNPVNPSDAVAGIDWSSGSPTYKPKSNRYMAVAWSSNQTLEFAQHAFLTQVGLALVNNRNVVTPPTNSVNYGVKRPFGSNGLIVVTHSTGSLVTSTALSRAMDGDFGTWGKQIAKRIRLHVSFAGAISGSRLATLGMAVGLAGQASGIPQAACAIAFAMHIPCNGNTGFVAHSIFRDLIPLVTQVVWGPDVNDTPVPTLTIAGGHPLGNYALGATKILLPGLDDGVVTMNSACGNPNPVYPGVTPPSGVTVSSLVKSFDMGIPAVRAAKNFVSHLDRQAPIPAAPYLAGACTPWLTPTGMVLPVTAAYGSTIFDARRRYGNHYSFIQGSIDHSYEGGGDSSNPWPSSQGLPASHPRAYLHTQFGPNCEEMSAVTDSGTYQQFADGTYLVHPSFANRVHRVIRGRKITFKLFKRTRTWWIWQRTYDLLDGLDCTKSSSHYVYQYVGRR